MSAARARPPVPPPSRSARYTHLRRSLSRVCDPQHVPARPSFYRLAVPVTCTCHRPLRLCRPSPAAVARPYARLRDCVRPSLHLAVPVTRTRTVLLAVSAGCHVCSTRPSARPSTLQCPPSALAPASSRVCSLRGPLARLQHVPVRPSLHRLAVLVTRTYTVLLAVSASPQHVPARRPPPGHPPVRRSAVRRRIRWPVRPLAVRLSACRPRRARPTHAHPSRPLPAARARPPVPPGHACSTPPSAPVNLAVTNTCAALASLPLAMRPPPGRPHCACACVSPVTRLLSTGTAYTWRLCHVIASST